MARSPKTHDAEVLHDGEGISATPDLEEENDVKHGTQKMATVIAHSFDALPAHIAVTGRGSASTVRVAAARALEAVICSPELKRKHIRSFKMSIVITHDAEVKPE